MAAAAAAAAAASSGPIDLTTEELFSKIDTIISTHGKEQLTYKTVRTLLEAELGLEPDALKPRKREIDDGIRKMLKKEEEEEEQEVEKKFVRLRDEFLKGDATRPAQEVSDQDLRRHLPAQRAIEGAVKVILNGFQGLRK